MTRKTAVVTVTVFVLAACAGDEGGDGDTTTSDDPPATAADPDDGESEEGESGDDPPAADVVELPGNVAAMVGTTVIETETVEEILEDAAASPAIASQIEADETGSVVRSLRAQVLTQLVVKEIVEEAAAEDFGIEVTEADVAASLEELEADTGTEGGLDATLEASGMSRDVFERLELPLLALLDRLEAEFGELPGSDAETGEAPEGRDALREWGTLKFAAADVAVSPDHGTWNPLTGQVRPPNAPAIPVRPGPGEN
ncbi:MAG: hypothetical protein WD225_00950 [Ilumatobacteraceae bacterium]